MSTPLPHAQIEPAGESDLAAISQLAGEIWRACYPEIITTAQIEYMLAQMYSLETLRKEIFSEGICYQRLLVAGESVGFASYGPAGSSAYKLNKLYLAPERHGCGLGRVLLRHCEEKIRGLGARRLILNVNKHNAKAIAFYQREGFTIVESVIVDIGGGFVMDDYVMEKKLLPS